MKTPLLSVRACWLLLLALGSGFTPLFAQNQQPNLPATPTAARFTLTDRTWPANPGEASLCLWADDKLAALSITVDDNNQADIPWWLQKAETYGFPVTWFVITGEVGVTYKGGTWSQFAPLVDLGHDVQSHTINHLNTAAPGWVDMNTEYRDSQLAIQANIANHSAAFLAYPGGANQNLNDRTLAAAYYAAARGTQGVINQANRIDYLSVAAMSSANIGNTSTAWSNLDNLFVTGSPYFRGWGVLIYHNVSNPTAAQTVFDFCATHATDLWLGAFGDIAKYGQQRDTATLAVTSSTATSITFSLTDQMLDSRFDQPLTVKVRLPASWTTVQATQNGQPADARIVTHNSAPYALVQAVPDRGNVVLSQATLAAAPLVYEDFNYTLTGNVATAPDSTTDFGWTGTTWTAGANDIIAGLTHASVTSSGNALQVSANVISARSINMAALPAALTQLDADNVTRLGKPGTTLWIRFLIRADAADTANTGTASLQLLGASSGGAQKLALGDLGTNLNWGIARRNYPAAPDVYSATPIVTGATTLLVARIKFVAGTNNDEVDLFVNPPVGATPPATPNAALRNVDIATFDRLNLSGNRLATIDEIALADDWSAVVNQPAGPTVGQITSNGVTWTFAGQHQAGAFVNGDPWVIGPVSVTSITNNLNSPAYTHKPGQNGSMINPGTNLKQGYESAIAQTYLASLNAGLPNGFPVSVSNPLNLPNGTTLVSSVSWLFNSATDREPGAPNYDAGYQAPRSATRSAGVLTVLSAVPPADAFRPPYVGTDKTIRFRTSQLDYTKLPFLAAPSGVTPPTFTSLANSFSKTWLDHVNSWIGAANHPTLHMPNYGRDMARLVADGTLRLFNDTSARGVNPEKDRLIIGLVQYGLDSAGIADNGGHWQADGGHGLSRKLPILLAGSLFNDAHMLAAGSWTTRFQEDEQTFYVTQAEIDVTNSPAWAPDSRTPSTPYTSADLGKAEWGIRHFEKPTSDNAHWGANYRDINGSSYPGFALAARHLGLKTAWNHNAFFDYADRYMVWRLSEPAPANQPTAFLVAMWNTHRPTAP